MIPSNQPHLEASAITDPGSKGRLNEDSYEISSFLISEDDPTPVMLAVVADGIGGHKAGEVASRIAVDTIKSSIEESDGSDPLWILKSALLEANHSITEAADGDETRTGMGSTVACTLVIDSAVYIATLGDSRIYLIRDDKIQQMTIDHTWVQEALEVGVINSEEARSHPRRHLIRSYLGSADPIHPDLRLYLDPEENQEQAKANQGLPMIPGDRILICSDGLTDLVEDEEILKMVQEDGSEDSHLQALVDLANDRGGHDNITVVLLYAPPEELFSEDDIEEEEPEIEEE